MLRECQADRRLSSSRVRFELAWIRMAMARFRGAPEVASLPAVTLEFFALAP